MPDLRSALPQQCPADCGLGDGGRVSKEGRLRPYQSGLGQVTNHLIKLCYNKHRQLVESQQGMVEGAAKSGRYYLTAPPSARCARVMAVHMPRVVWLQL